VISRDQIERIIRKYYDGCNEADEGKIIECFTPGACHYFPVGAPQGTFFGAVAVAAGWRAAVIDEGRGEAAIEWTHFKPAVGGHLRGVELCRFGEDGLIEEIRAFYACPEPKAGGTYELGDFDYRNRGYPLAPPAVERRPT
jgi:hypothetical protein